jgi:ubiquinone/menaquinone biosynthesis C-methylase UbiE
MHWRVKGAIQKILGVVPHGERLHYLLQRTAGGLKNFDHELDMKVEDWGLMVGHLRNAGIALEGSTLLEMGTGWYPTFPLCLYFTGAKRIETVDLNRQMKPELMLQCAVGLGQRADVLAKTSGREVREILELQRATVSAMERGADVEEATGGVIRYRAPADASKTGLPDASIDVVFSNSVLEHVVPDAIERCFREAARILRDDGVIFHSANCGDHYAYVDRRISQLHYLRYSDAEWGRWNNAFLYQNRLRAVDFTDMARAAGFVIEIDTSRPHPKRLAELAKVEVHPRFARYSRDELAITSIDFIGRKRSVAQETSAAS